MVYCKKCARLLDEDVRFCPYCQNEDEGFVEKTETDAVSEKLRQIDEQIALNRQPPEPQTLSEAVKPEPPVASSDPRVNIPRPNSEYVDPRSITVEPASFARTAAVDNEAPSTGLYVGMVLLSVFLSLPGLIVGIVYMTNKKPAYRKMGLVMLIISIVVTIVSLISCCAMFYAIGSSYGDIGSVGF